MTRKEFNEKYPIYTRDSKSAIFEDRETLLSQLLEENIPFIWILIITVVLNQLIYLH